MDISKIQSQTPKVDSTPCPPAKNDEVKDDSGSCFDIPVKNEDSVSNKDCDPFAEFEKMHDEILFIQDQIASLDTPKAKDNEPCPNLGPADGDTNGIAPNENEFGEVDSDKRGVIEATPDEAEPNIETPKPDDTAPDDLNVPKMSREPKEPDIAQEAPMKEGPQMSPKEDTIKEESPMKDVPDSPEVVPKDKTDGPQMSPETSEPDDVTMSHIDDVEKVDTTKDSGIDAEPQLSVDVDGPQMSPKEDTIKDLSTKEDQMSP